MVTIMNVADLPDPNDAQGRTYRQVNNARKHGFGLGQLVELGNGCRLFIRELTRDCDGTPLYTLCADMEDHDRYWLRGYSEDTMTAVAD